MEGPGTAVSEGGAAAASPPTLALRVYESLANEHAPWEDLIGLEGIPDEAISDNRGDLSAPPDLARLLTWAFLYGGAYVAARMNNPLGCEETWKTLARDAANKASRWHMTVGGRPEGEC